MRRGVAAVKSVSTFLPRVPRHARRAPSTVRGLRNAPEPAQPVTWHVGAEEQHCASDGHPDAGLGRSHPQNGVLCGAAQPGGASLHQIVHVRGPSKAEEGTRVRVCERHIQLGLALMSACLAKEGWRPHDAQTGANGRGRFTGCVVEEFVSFKAAQQKILTHLHDVKAKTVVTELRQTRTDGRSVSFGSTCRVAHVVHAAGRAVETTACPSPARGPLAARRGSRAVCPDAQGTRVRRATRMDFCGACAATHLRWAEDSAAVWAAVTWRLRCPHTWVLA